MALCSVWLLDMSYWYQFGCTGLVLGVLICLIGLFIASIGWGTGVLLFGAVLAGTGVMLMVLNKQPSQTPAIRERTDYPNRYIPKAVREAVYLRDGGRCVDCGSDVSLEYDHIIPVSKGGAATVNNVQLLCSDCNRRKSGRIGG